MRLKLYRARAMAEAMARIRSELGPDAVILSSRRVAEGVEVTAALEADPGPVPLLVAPLPTATPHAAGPCNSDPRLALLRRHGVPAELHGLLAASSLKAALAGALPFAALPDAALLFAGPPGAGKTLTVARLATRFVLAGMAPLVITADGARAGAAEQLAAFTRLLGIDLIVADTPHLLARALARRQEGTPVLIDGAGADPRDAEAAETTAALAAAASARLVAVLPAGIDPGEAGEMAASLHASGAAHLVATRLDGARRLGSVLAAAAAGPALAEAGIGPGAADGLVPLTPALLAERLERAAAEPTRTAPRRA
jgi:flagellar biosynthesis protein FlhF